MRMTDKDVVQAKFFQPAISTVQRKCAHCEEEEKKLQRMEENSEEVTINSELEGYVDKLSTRGKSLPGEVRSFFEPRMGYDLGNVKVHTDSVAAKSASSINALAYTSGNNIVFNQGQYSPDSDSGKRLLGHELAHVIQQNSGVHAKSIQRKYKLNDLYQNGAPVSVNPIGTSPDILFYKGSAANASDRKALIIAGIHGSEPPASALGNEIKAQLDSGTAHTDFHTILVPHLSPSADRSAGTTKAGTHVKDLNRQFGTGYTSPNPLANTVAQIVTEFDPERIMSIHAIDNPNLGGVFLDPVNSGIYPPTKTPADNAQAFTGDPRNTDAMLLADSMISAIGNAASTRGNVPVAKRPPSHYPGAGTGSSPNSLIYPKQEDISTKAPTSLGVWGSTLGKPVYTVEIPGYDAKPAIWKTFLPGIWKFLEIPKTAPTLPPAPVAPPQPKTGDEFMKDFWEVIDLMTKSLPPPLPVEARPATLKKSCLSFVFSNDVEARKTFWAGVIASMPVADVVNWVIGISLPKAAKPAIDEAEEQKKCMLSALAISASTKGSTIEHKDTPTWESGRRDFADQNTIWQQKFNFTRKKFDRISDNARKICGSLLSPADKKWDKANENHRRCWGVAPKGTAPPFPSGARSLTDDERQLEILQASSAPGISRHHWGTEFDIFSDVPEQWTTTGPGKNFADEYAWLERNAFTYGFMQPFTIASAFKRFGYMEERWHWSYWPVAQALLEFVGTHDADVQAVLTSKWGTAPEFSFISKHWREFMNNVEQNP